MRHTGCFNQSGLRSRSNQSAPSPHHPKHAYKCPEMPVKAGAGLDGLAGPLQSSVPVLLKTYLLWLHIQHTKKPRITLIFNSFSGQCLTIALAFTIKGLEFNLCHLQRHLHLHGYMYFEQLQLHKMRSKRRVKDEISESHQDSSKYSQDSKAF